MTESPSFSYAAERPFRTAFPKLTVVAPPGGIRVERDVAIPMHDGTTVPREQGREGEARQGHQGRIELTLGRHQAWALALVVDRCIDPLGVQVSGKCSVDEDTGM